MLTLIGYHYQFNEDEHIVGTEHASLKLSVILTRKLPLSSVIKRTLQLLFTLPSD